MRASIFVQIQEFINHLGGVSKFIIHPNYKMKVNRDQIKLVNFITATRRTDKKEFNGKRYIKIETTATLEE